MSSNARGDELVLIGQQRNLDKYWFSWGKLCHSKDKGELGFRDIGLLGQIVSLKGCLSRNNLILVSYLAYSCI